MLHELFAFLISIYAYGLAPFEHPLDADADRLECASYRRFDGDINMVYQHLNPISLSLVRNVNTIIEAGNIQYYKFA